MTVESGAHQGSVAVAAPRLSWTTETTVPGWLQGSAEIELDGGAVVRSDGRGSVGIDWPFEPLRPHERRSVRVRVTGQDAVTSDWSEPLAITAAFLDEGEWHAELIGLAAPELDAQPFRVRREFAVGSGLVRATLFGTALGVYQARINGADVDDQILKPGWTPYAQRLIHESTDVTALLASGSVNAIVAEVAGGWYTEHWFLPQPRYGAQPSVALQLRLEYADGRVETVATDASWTASASGPIRASGIYDGEHVDARRETPGWDLAGFEGTGWTSVRFAVTPVIPEARTSPAVRVTERLPVAAVITTPSGMQVLDFGQNLVGRLRVRLSGAEGTLVTIRHAEVLENDELGVRPLRAAKATDTFVLTGGVDVWEARFTFHGFRYAEITGLDEPLDPRAVEAHVIHSDLRRTGWFESSNPLLNRLHENAVWSMRGNFLYLPTDCPQRDERLGWTGDIQVFAPTAASLFDVDSFLSSWLVDLALEQTAVGGSVPFVIPNVIADAATPAAAWGDAATVVPSVLHERYGDSAVLAAQYPSMRDWTDHLLGLAGATMLWQGGFQFGDWLDPTAPPDDAFQAMTDPGIVATAYLIRSADLTAAAARLLGCSRDAERFADAAERAREAFVAAYIADGLMLSDSQTAYALALEFGIVRDPALRARLGDRLAALVAENDHRIGTGFVGTPIVADALTRAGHLATAGRLLIQEGSPSWLHPVTMGATTIWERWDSMLEDGSINPGDMTSFNHYALGAVVDWLHRTVAGLAPAEPGYRRLLIAPQPLEGLEHARARLDTPYGPAEVAWRREGGGVVVHAVVPPNAEADVLLLGGGPPIHVGSGSHRWRLAATEDPPQAQRTDGGSHL
ncbi:alpha-L-rhamnosidase [Rathayibacter sp. VKM Ac-2760]|uniref:alpha-L-rhamnosidase n=1 Tax=Rathayibacter sp. VKM Ac-2760 TaxID=2609253 RepID=UPI001FC9D2F8|nr:alpha-L-rhamnosidase [Rathayibacter sp. VKM Ac-2760]